MNIHLFVQSRIAHDCTHEDTQQHILFFSPNSEEDSFIEDLFSSSCFVPPIFSLYQYSYIKDNKIMIVGFLLLI